MGRTLKECQEIMAAGNLAAERLAKEFFVGKRQLLVQVLFGNDNIVDPKTTLAIRSVPERPLIQAVRDIHDEVQHLVGGLQTKLASNYANRYRFVTDDEFKTEAHLATTNAIFAYMNIRISFLTFSGQCMLNGFTNYIRFVTQRGKRAINFTDLNSQRIMQRRAGLFVWDFTKKEPDKPIDYFQGIPVDLVRKCYETAVLDPRERMMLKARVEGKPLAHAAKEIGVSKPYGTQLYQSARDIVRRRVESIMKQQMYAPKTLEASC